MTLFRAPWVPYSLTRWCLCAVLVTASGCRSEGKPESPKPAAATEEPTDLHGTGGVEGVDAAYDRARQPARFIAALGITPGQRIADVGAGQGYFTQRLAEAVGPTGQVVATDINDEAIRRLRARMLARKNVEVRKVEPDAPGLEAGAYDLILLSEVDHFLGDRVDYLTRLRPALTPQGRIAVTHLRAMRPPLVAAAQAAGYTLVSEYNDLPDHYLLFLRPAVSP